jgi:hypothetical protein
LELKFKVGVTENAPEDGDSVFTYEAYISKKLNVFREGELQFDSSATSGYEYNVSTGVITFHPPLAEGERIIIQAYPTTDWTINGLFAPAGYDSDAQAFFTATGITNTTQKDAVNELVLDLKAASVWTKIKVLYPFVGGTATTHKYNLKNPLDTDAAFRISFTGGWTHGANGATGNGSTAKGDTYFNPDAQFTDNERAYLGVYLGGTSETGEYIPVGSRDGIADFYMKPKGGDGLLQGTCNSQLGGAAVASPLGYSSITHRTGGNIRTFKNGSPLSPLLGVTAGTPNYNVTIGCLNNLNTDYGFISSDLRAIIICDDEISDTEDAAIYAALLAFQTALGR